MYCIVREASSHISAVIALDWIACTVLYSIAKLKAPSEFYTIENLKRQVGSSSCIEMKGAGWQRKLIQLKYL